MTRAGPELTSRGRHPARLSFHPRRDGYDVRIVADGLDVRCTVHCLSTDDGLTAFVDELAERFRGWDGARSWCSLEDRMTIDATWGDGGHVALDVHVRPGVDAGWELRTTFTVDAGSQMTTLATDLARFFDARE